MLRAARSSGLAIGTGTGSRWRTGSTACRLRPLLAATAGFAGRASWARRIELAVVEPTHRAPPMNGAKSSRSCRLNASISPRMPIAASSTNVPGPVSSGSSVPARKRPMRPPPRSASKMSTLRTSNAPRPAMNAIARPASVIPQPEPGCRPGPPATYQPPPSSRNGSNHRPVSNHGAIESRHQSVSAPCPGSISAISVMAPSAIIVVPTIDRTTSGVKTLANFAYERRPPPRREPPRGAARRCRAMPRPRPRPGRPSGVASSVHTGSAKRRP